MTAKPDSTFAQRALPAEPQLEVWRGAVNAWNCDEMGHMNVRFYLARAIEGLAGVAAVLGLEDAYSPKATSTLEVKGHHVRFLREAREGDPIHIEAGLLRFGEDEARVVQVMRHSRSGEPCAAFVSRVQHTTPGGRSFPWSAKARDAAEGLMCLRPGYAEAKGVTDQPASSKASLTWANAMGLIPTARGVATPDECDALGRFRSDAVMGRFSDAASQLFGGFDRGRTDSGARIGGAMLEIHILHHRTPCIGQHLSLRSGLAKIEPRFNHIVHWLLDPITGEPWSTARGVAAAFDLDARKIVERTPEQLTTLQSKVFEGLDL
ncbi:MAG TPA: thioesterase family protein [Caulobacteraceae bacterium]|nr:thioesterase family protein [Caulobacteraceae bacterium]